MMRKEVDAMRSARTLLASRSSAYSDGMAFDVGRAASDVACVVFRLMDAGVVLQEDWERVASSDLSPGGVVGPAHEAMRASLRSSMEVRMVNVALATPNFRVAMVSGYFDDCVDLLVELACFRQAYDAVVRGVAAHRRRTHPTSWLPGPMEVERFLGATYRSQDPDAAVEQGNEDLAEGKAKVAWGRSRSKRLAGADADPVSVARLPRRPRGSQRPQIPDHGRLGAPVPHQSCRVLPTGLGACL